MKKLIKSNTQFEEIEEYVELQYKLNQCMELLDKLRLYNVDNIKLDEVEELLVQADSIIDRF